MTLSSIDDGISDTRIMKIFANINQNVTESQRLRCPCGFSPISNSTGNQPQDNRYQSSIRKPVEFSDLSKCKYAKSQVENDICTTQRLLNKIQHLKKSIQDLESAQQNIKVYRNSGHKDVPSQTEDPAPPELNNARQIVNNCIAEMSKLKTFLEDENCWWKIFRKREFNCCEQKLPHLHGFLDGTMVTLKMLEETLDPNKEFVTSTPIRSRSLENHGPEMQFDEGKKYKEQDTDTARNLSKMSPRTSFQVDQKTIDSCLNNCPVSCRQQTPNSPRSTYSRNHSQIYPGTSKEPSRNETLQREERRINPINQLPKQMWQTKSAIGFGQRPRPSYTFSSENTARRKIIAADISTSTDLITEIPYKNIAVSAQSFKSLADGSFLDQNQNKMSQGGSRSKSRSRNSGKE
ncbi:uncharacterized protein LOC114878782 [Osmia bicornis bicornis]|uniref:uncharacterized protein LOC114878782 n=1 Tax=Osmia bicornis bicornis TaxID=1437191 RepID=UPI001EAF2AA5|nr:uncharacterized protein LOC114878782 [Osmia bicornis bicornis]